ncbi:alpha/beta hydrolase family protein [Hellea balneolensis]|uniref:alpha/beta hydrolase family protein n=1 Tax=Hellea balneolensis TaxID=287478 RepID=UPI0003FB1FC1|nr:alpha/beta fold hydrolase [Hellea balneolensis]
MPSEKVEFKGAFGDTLSAKIDWPDEGELKSWVLFAHGFSIGKDLKPIRTISKSLVDDGYGMLRFDFTGLGESKGNFSDTNFTSNCEDIRMAANYLREFHGPPCVMIGHSFGGTATLKVADEIPECKAVATIGSPCDTTHIVHQFADQIEEIEEEGEAKVLLGGRPFIIKEQFLEDIGNQDIAKEIADLDRALMIFHSPQDKVVSIDNAAHIYGEARHPKSFVSLDGADHLLLKNPADAEYVAHVLAAWAHRYI